ncbi:MAG: hypothetical protein KAW93_08070 [Methanogenium sp.]|nr:hypothetical protein [Methanogenium sp.]
MITRVSIESGRDSGCGLNSAVNTGRLNVVVTQDSETSISGSANSGTVSAQNHTISGIAGSSNNDTVVILSGVKGTK